MLQNTCHHLCPSQELSCVSVCPTAVYTPESAAHLGHTQPPPQALGPDGSGWNPNSVTRQLSAPGQPLGLSVLTGKEKMTRLAGRGRCHRAGVLFNSQYLSFKLQTFDFAVNSRGTQPYRDMCPFFPKPLSHPGCTHG